ncbi:MAG: hypothetical protein Q7T81_04100 [Pseudolabrys sp.]|nr:hypothetical protein [Pseudolabrys sp.]
MNGKLRKSLSVVAIFALAMHAILFGVPMQAAAKSVDPFTVICHSGPVDPAAPEPAPASQPTKACDHCSLCFVAGTLDAPDTILVELLTPPSVLHVLVPASTAARVHFAAHPHLPRGPPSTI